MNFYRRFPADYANDTRHLDFIHHGAYTLLLDHCYSTERPLPADHGEIYRLMCARTDLERGAIDSVLREFFRLGQRGYTHKRVRSEIERCESKKEVLRANGRKGGLSKVANAKQMLGKSLASQTLDSRRQTLDKDLKPGPQNTRPVIPLPVQKNENLSPEQIRYSDVGRLVFGALSIVSRARSMNRSTQSTDCREELKEWAARNNLPYDATMISDALDVADGKTRALAKSAAKGA